MGRKVRGPDGRSWRVHRVFFVGPRWGSPWPKRKIGFGAGGEFAGPVGGADPLFWLVLLIWVAAILVWIVFPTLAFLLGGIYALVLALVALVAHALFGKRCVLEARTSGPPAERRRWTVRGWGRSSKAIEGAGRAIAGGGRAPGRHWPPADAT